MRINWFKIQKELFINQIKYDFIFGNPRDYVKTLIYLKQGFNCKDCKNSCLECECNKCEYCKFNFCLCNLNLNCYIHLGYVDFEKNKIRKAIYNFTIKNLSKYLIIILINILKEFKGIEAILITKPIIENLENDISTKY